MITLLISSLMEADRPSANLISCMCLVSLHPSGFAPTVRHTRPPAVQEKETGRKIWLGVSQPLRCKLGYTCLVEFSHNHAQNKSTDFNSRARQIGVINAC